MSLDAGRPPHPTDGRAVARRAGLLLLTLTIYWAAVLWLRSDPPVDEGVLQLQRMDWAPATDPAPKSAGSPRGLPVDGFRQPEVDGWYSADITLAARPQQAWAVYLPQVVMNAAVSVNGRLIGQGGSLTPPVARHWARPLWFLVPDGLLRAGSNRLTVRLASEPAGTGLLGKVYLGPAARLEPLYRYDRLVRVGVAETAFIITLATSLLIALLAWLRPAESLYRWYAAGLGAWALHDLNLLLIEPPLPVWLWNRLNTVTVFWFAVCCLFFTLRLLCLSRPLFERTVLTLAVIATLLMPFTPDALHHPVRLPVWETLALLLAFYPALLMLHAYFSRDDLEITVLALSSVVITSGAIRDWLVIAGLLERGPGFLMHFGAPVGVLALGCVLVSRFNRALRRTEQLNSTLEQRVRENSAELERNLETLHAYRRRQAIADERSRIMRDMHDGVGSQLVSTLAAVESGRADLGGVALALRDALNDLRLIVDAVDPNDADIGRALARLRRRLDAQLTAAGIVLEWRVKPLATELHPQAQLQLLRIVQEALSNAIRHSGCRRLRVSCSADGVVEISDDGRGMAAAANAGNGLSNMRTRARAINAELSIDAASPNGTRVRILLPVPTGAAAESRF